MLIGGLWHGASWTFVLWGLYHGVLLVVYRWLAPDLGTRPLSPLARAFHQVFFFHLVCVGWMLFRAKTFHELSEFVAAFSRSPILEAGVIARLLFAAPVFVLEFAVYTRKDQLALLRLPWWLRVIVYFGMYWALLSTGRWTGEGFIYFQF